MAVLVVSPCRRCIHNATEGHRKKKKNRGHCDRHILGSTLFALAPALAKPEPAALHRLFFASLCA